MHNSWHESSPIVHTRAQAATCKLGFILHLLLLRRGYYTDASFFVLMSLPNRCITAGMSRRLLYIRVPRQQPASWASSGSGSVKKKGNIKRSFSCSQHMFLARSFSPSSYCSLSLSLSTMRRLTLKWSKKTEHARTCSCLHLLLLRRVCYTDDVSSSLCQRYSCPVAC